MNISGKKNLTDSPCIGVCSATALGDPICRGCGRTFEEVHSWNTLSDAEKIEINQRLSLCTIIET
ncbi:MAG: DUF1289 domain-containing protein [Gammaproteobacteria bacterium RIFCSPHIGHO2_12_FULL_45_9]|nr:MAG: DUF1289 domain-containing protein [Gammaproteobacteria bacterium RIFCSPHIGHO2_12_FULL_45_9]